MKVNSKGRLCRKQPVPGSKATALKRIDKTMKNQIKPGWAVARRVRHGTSSTKHRDSGTKGGTVVAPGQHPQLERIHHSEDPCR